MGPASADLHLHNDNYIVHTIDAWLPVLGKVLSEAKSPCFLVFIDFAVELSYCMLTVTRKNRLYLDSDTQRPYSQPANVGQRQYSQLPSI